MKVLLPLTFLAALGLVAEANLGHLKPLDIMMPVNPKYTAQEWKEIYAAQKPRPDDYPNFKKGTEAQPEHAGKVDVLLQEQHQRGANCITAASGQFPWVVSIIVDNAYLCGGSLIGPQWILTAAHCVYSGRSYQISLGSTYYDGRNGTIETSTNATVHPNYTESTISNNIALIRLPNPVNSTTNISPIRLRNIAGDLAFQPVRVSGWVRSCDSSILVPGLQYADLTVITNAQCSSFYGTIITSSKLCTVNTDSVDTCSLFSANPLAFLENDGIYTQVGILSFTSSYGCESGYPDVFTRVTSYLRWISSVTGIIFGN